MTQPIDIGALLKLRKITRRIADDLRSTLQKHLATLAPLLMTRQILGRHVDGDAKFSVRGEDEALNQLNRLYQQIAKSREFSLPSELESPLRLRQTGLDVCAADYTYEATDGENTKKVTILTPTRWVVFPTGCPPSDLRDLVEGPSTSADDVRRYVLHYLAHHILLSGRPNIVELFADLRFPIKTGKLAGCGDLPFSIIESPVRTVRAGDDLIIQSTELTGTDTFEEVIDETIIANMVDPLRCDVTALMET